MKYQVFNLFVVAKHLQHFRDDKIREQLIDMIAFARLFCWRQIIFGKRWNLWIPIPRIAAHMHSSFLAPTFPWVEEPSMTLESLQMEDVNVPL
jgi:hypothetical protein